MNRLLQLSRGFGIPTLILIAGIYLIIWQIKINKVIYASSFFFLLCFVVFIFILLDRKTIRKIRIIDLLNHSVFNMLHNIKMDVRATVFANDRLKDLMVKDYLLINYKVSEETLINKINERSKKNKSCSGSCGWVQKSVEQNFEEINKIFREIGGAELFIDKIMQFLNPHIDIFLSVSRNICSSRYYNSCMNKIPAHLSNCEFIFQLTFLNAKKALNGINGELDKILQEGDYLEKRKAYIDKYNLVRI